MFTGEPGAGYVVGWWVRGVMQQARLSGRPGPTLHTQPFGLRPKRIKKQASPPPKLKGHRCPQLTLQRSGFSFLLVTPPKEAVEAKIEAQS